MGETGRPSQPWRREQSIPEEVISARFDLQAGGVTTTTLHTTGSTPQTSLTRPSSLTFDWRFRLIPFRSFALTRCWQPLKREEREVDRWPSRPPRERTD